MLPYLRRHPDDAAGLLLLAEIAVQIGAYNQAEGFLRNVLSRTSADVQALLKLGQVLFAQGRLADAIAALDASLLLDPDNGKVLALKGSALEQLGDYQQAIAVQETLLERDAGCAAAWVGYGHRLRMVGRLQEAEAAYRRAIELKGALGEAWWGLANSPSVRLGQGDIEAIMSALNDDRLDRGWVAPLHFALGRAFEDMGAYETSFRHFSEGNRIRRAELAYDPQTLTDETRRSAALFTPAFFAERDGQGCVATDPIFILGMPRAGSTLLEQILATHSMVEGTSELPHIPAMVHRLMGEMWRPEDQSYPQLLAGLSPPQLKSLGEEYLERARMHRRTDRPFFIDKMPHNWADIGLIHLILPKARIIDARRNPLSCCFSNFRQYFAKGHPASYSLEDMARHYRDYVRADRPFRSRVARPDPPGHPREADRGSRGAKSALARPSGPAVRAGMPAFPRKRPRGHEPRARSRCGARSTARAWTGGGRSSRGSVPSKRRSARSSFAYPDVPPGP